MKKKKYKKPKEKKRKAGEPPVAYGKHDIRIFHSFEEQSAYERKKMAELSPVEMLMQLRKMINIAFGMHGYDPHHLPTKHSIKITGYQS